MSNSSEGEKSMKKFDFYEFAGVLCPGAVVVFGLSKIYPTLAPLISKQEGASIGDLGFFVILSYIAGHLVQAVGNVFEKFWWMCWGGLPSNWLRSTRERLLTKEQKEHLRLKFEKLTGTHIKPISDLRKKEWFVITRRMYAIVSHAGRSGRIDIFNGNYGMFRGIGAAMFVLIAASLVEVGWQHPRRYAILGGALILALLRMHRFGVHYARELFVQFLTTEKTDKAPQPASE
jgi:hypothetical protein